MNEAEVQRLRLFYRVDADGSILEVVHTHVLRGAGWHEATSEEDMARLLHEAGRWRRAEDGTLRERPTLAVTVNDLVFKADGEDAAEFMLHALTLAEEAATLAPVEVQINGVAARWGLDTRHTVTTLTPGTWLVTITDRRFHAEERTAIATAHPPEHFQK